MMAITKSTLQLLLMITARRRRWDTGRILARLNLGSSDASPSPPFSAKGRKSGAMTYRNSPLIFNHFHITFSFRVRSTHRRDGGRSRIDQRRAVESRHLLPPLPSVFPAPARPCILSCLVLALLTSPSACPRAPSIAPPALAAT